MKLAFGDLIAGFLILALCLFAAIPRYTSNLDLGDEGLLAYGGERVLQGQVPNRDFVSLQPPLSFYSIALFYKIFGKSLLTLRIMGVIIYVTIPLLLYAIARNFSSIPFSFLSALPSMFLGISYAHFVPVAVWQSVVACLAAVLLVLLAARNSPAKGLALVSGGLTAAAVFLRQDQGFYLLIAITTLLITLHFAKKNQPDSTNPKVAAILWIIGIAVVSIPLGIYWLAAGAIKPMFQQLVLFPLTTYSKTSALPFPLLRSGLTLGADTSILLYYAAPLAIIVSISILLISFRKASPEHTAILTFLIVWSALFYCQVLVRTDMDHLLITLPPLFLLGPLVLGIIWRWIGTRAAKKSEFVAKLTKSIAALILLMLLAGFFILLKPQFLPEPIKPEALILLDRARVRKLGAANITKFVERIQQLAPEDRSILCLPYEPMFYFLSGRRNPTHWNYLWPGDQTPADHRELIAQARKDLPAAVILTRESDMAKYASEITDYVHSEYELVANAGGLYSIYIPKATIR